MSKRWLKTEDRQIARQLKKGGCHRRGSGARPQEA